MKSLKLISKHWTAHGAPSLDALLSLPSANEASPSSGGIYCRIYLASSGKWHAYIGKSIRIVTRQTEHDNIIRDSTKYPDNPHYVVARGALRSHVVILSTFDADDPVLLAFAEQI